MEEKSRKQGDPGRLAGALIFDGHSLVHSVRFFPYEMLVRTLELFGTGSWDGDAQNWQRHTSTSDEHSQQVH